MRAYTITTGFNTRNFGVREVVSSKRLAIAACEQNLREDTGTSGLSWTSKLKHTGTVETKGEFWAKYEMFYINQGPNVEKEPETT